MSNSALSTYTLISPNKTSPRNHPIDTVTIHCFVAQVTAKRGCEVFQPKSMAASCNYVVGYDGSIGLCVDETDRSWCSSNGQNDHRAITIEVASDNTPPYAITEAAYNSLIKLLVDVCQRNNIEQLRWKGDKTLIGQTEKQNMTVHRWFAPKECPGEYLYNLHGKIAEDVNKQLPPVVPKPIPHFTPYHVRINTNALRIRKGAGTNTAVEGMIAPGVYTIVEEADGPGAKKWGKLKSGTGWIALDYTEKL